VLSVTGAWARFWGFEIQNSSPQRRAVEGGSSPRDLRRGAGIHAFAPHTQYINLVIHDVGNGIGFWNPAYDSLVYGCIVFNNGWLADDRGHGHGLYIQNVRGKKTVEDVISFNNLATGMKAFATNGTVKSVFFRGVTSFNNGSLASSGNARQPNILVGTDDIPADNVGVHSNLLYHVPQTNTANLQLGYTAPGRRVSVTGNRVAGGRPLFLKDWRAGVVRANRFIAMDTAANERREIVHVSGVGRDSMTWDRNFYADLTSPWPGKQVPYGFHFNGRNFSIDAPRLTYGEWRRATGWDRHSEHRKSYSVVRSIVRRNRFEPGRGQVIVYNFAGASHASARLGRVLDEGDAYGIYNVQGLFEDPEPLEPRLQMSSPIKTGTFTGGPVSIPLRNLDVTDPFGVGLESPGTTAPRFGVFLVKKLNERRISI
jgi:hypothetical protein